ncbi:flagellin [Ensifer adhaerens]|jgi:flagellin|uniref:Flagellin n=6 Tax=Ensifer TaxID=106591 RepID=A0A9Q8Y9L2_ENSAD|nr:MULTISPECIES: flagellin [Ensifer]OWZ95215.1 flagellin [Sinorhizobium sp. LM21]ANK71411.1 flagellin [Ensifer adhaerens]MBD9538570.1 flagellin [Ensifer sp. ENS04]MBD9555359.1 flagellin [Ensifer sp. ENS03]MBD9567407.1 flagellin [Ensifer sp. ENS08]
MTSIITNSSAMGALATLRSINSSMETTQERISSGLRVGTAADNAAYWSIATTMRSDNKALSAVQDALGLGAAKTDVASSAMENSKDVVDEIKKKLVTASEPGVDKSKIQKEIKELQNQLVSIAKSASFSGENWVYTDPNNAAGTKSVVGSFNRDAKGNVSLTTLQYDTNKSSLIEVNASGANVTNGTGLLSSNISYTDTTGATVSLTFSVLSLDITSMTNGALSQALSGVDSVLTQMTDAAADLGALNSRIDLQKGFVENLSDSIEKGVGRLVDADMNEESTRLKALQTQQQLGIQALSIANSNSQNILSLFR